MATIVMKFGGSLLASRGGITRAADLALSRKKAAKVIVVVSALGDVTDILLKAATRCRSWKEREIQRAVDELRSIHRAAIEQSSFLAEEKAEVGRNLESTLEKLRETLLGISILGELSPRSRDLVASFGERMSAPIMSAVIRSRGVASTSLTGGEAGIVTDSNFGEASPDRSATAVGVRRRLLPLMERGGVPVVAGFVARSKEGEITTLGRGGSDYTATLLASAMDADEVWIWTDVDGILTADPRVVKSPSPVSQLSYAEAEELAFFGAKNMHPLALGPARVGEIPVWIKNGFRPDLPGTLITKEQTKLHGVVKVIAVVKNVGLLTVAGETLQGRPGIAAEVFSALASDRVNILMISQSVSEANISLIVRRASLRHAETILRHRLKGQDIQVVGDPGVSVVAAVGAGMRGEQGVAARVFSAVASRGINVRMIAQGSSELNISFVVDERNADEAVRALHTLVTNPPGGKAGSKRK